MNKNILAKEVQDYINSHLNADVSRIALSKSPFAEASAAELANQIAAKKKAEKKLPTWFRTPGIYYPNTLSIEQTSSEETAKYKSTLAKGRCLLDLTAGFGVDSFYFSQQVNEVYSCEVNTELAAIASYNAKVLGVPNIEFLATDGLDFLKDTEKQFDTIYIDPARRNSSGKVFKLADCTPNVVEHLEMLWGKANRIIIKTSPLLDIQAGLTELKQVSEIHIVSVKNECKELLWVLDKGGQQLPKIICVALNGEIKRLLLPLQDAPSVSYANSIPAMGFIYEPDAALMKSGAFNEVARIFSLLKLHRHSHLYYADTVNKQFMGRIFEIEAFLTPNELKKEKNLKGNVLVRNFPEQPEVLVKKYKIAPSKSQFLIFTQGQTGYMVVKAKIIQYY